MDQTVTAATPKQALAERDLKLLAPYLPEGRIPENAKVHGNLHFWQVKEGKQTTKYAVGILEHPDTPRPGRDLKAQNAVSKGTGFDAGHLIGHQFGGPEIPGNLSLQNPTMNHGGGNWYKMEAQWANDLRQDNRIAVVVKEVTRADTPSFLYRNVNSLTIDGSNKVRHEELSALNPETERAMAAQGRSPAPEVPGGATILDLRPTLERQAEISREAEQAAQRRLDQTQAPEQPAKGYKRILAQVQSWRGRGKESGKENELAAGEEPKAEKEVFGTLSGPEELSKAAAQVQADADQRLQKLKKQSTLPDLDKITSTMNPKTGDVTYSISGKAAMVDRGKTITVLQTDPASTRLSLEMAVQKYGRSVNAAGTPAFQKQIIDAALQMRADITFTDPKLQARFIEAKAELQKKEDKLKEQAAQASVARAPDKPSVGDVRTPAKPASPVRDPERAFLQHADVLQQRYGFGLDAEKADGIIALKMARTGWKPEEIASALKMRSLNPDLPDKDSYAKQVTVQAFGKAAREAAIDRSAAMDLGR